MSNTTTYTLSNCTGQEQEFPIGRRKLQPRQTITIREPHFKSTGVQRVLAQGRFSVVNRQEMKEPVPPGGDETPVEAPKKRRRSKKTS